MSRVSRLVCLCSALVLLGLSVAQEPAHAASEAACRKAALQRLVELGVDPKDVQSVSIVQTQRSGLGESTRRAQESTFSRNQLAQRSGAAIRLKSCAGTVVMTMDQFCNVDRVDTRGDCKVPGLSDDQGEDPGWWPFKD